MLSQPRVCRLKSTGPSRFDVQQFALADEVVATGRELFLRRVT